MTLHNNSSYLSPLGHTQPFSLSPLPFSFLNSKYQPNISASEARIVIIVLVNRMPEETGTPGPKSQRDGGESFWSQEWELSCWGRSRRQHLVTGKGTCQLFQRDVKETETRWSVSPNSLALSKFSSLARASFCSWFASISTGVWDGLTWTVGQEQPLRASLIVTK